MSLAKLLMLTLIQGGLLTTSFAFPNFDISKTQELQEEYGNVSDPMIAYSSSQVKGIRLRKREAGRQVVISAEDIKRMAQIPISALSCQLPEVRNMILDCHNKYRRQVSPCASNMLKMIWSELAQKTAEAYAKKCQSGHSSQAERQITNFKCGENIFYCDEKVDWTTVVDAWYSEYVDFTYGKETDPSIEIGHYTQMMWASSYLMGCGMAECPNGPSKYLFVCHYCPAGNKGSRKCPWKEGKTCQDCPNACDNSLCTNGCPVQDFFSDCPNYFSGCASDPSMNGEKCPGTCQCTKGEIK